MFVDMSSDGVIQRLNPFAEKLIDQVNISLELRRQNLSELERTQMTDLSIKSLQVDREQGVHS